MTATDRHDRPFFLRKAAIVLLAGLVLLATLLAYLHTRHAFRHLLVPLAASVTGATLDVRDGWFALPGTVEVDGLVYGDEGAGVTLEAERVAITVTPWSFADGMPRIDEFLVKAAHLRMAPPQPAEAPDRRPEPEAGASVPWLPVAIVRARFEDVLVTLDGDGSRLTGRIIADIQQLRPGETGSVNLRTTFVLSRVDQTENLSGALNLAVSVASGPRGMPIAWNGTNRVLVRRGGGDAPLEEVDPQVVVIDQRLDGELAPAGQQVRLSSTMTIAGQGVPMGSATMTAAVNAGAQPAVTDLEVSLKGVTADAVNLVLGSATARLDGGAWNADVAARIEGTTSSLRATVAASRVQVRVGEREVSPPLDMTLQHTGAFDSATRELSVETLTIGIGDGATPMLAGGLDRPVTLRLAPLEEARQGSASSGEPAVWSLRLAPTGVATWRPWLAWLGAEGGQAVAEGRLGGVLSVTVHEQGALIEVVGRMEAEGVTLRSEHRDRPASVGPLGIVSDWKARVTGLQAVRLDALTTTVRVKAKQVAALRLTGAATVAGETALTALDGSLTLAGLPGEALNPLLARWTATRIRGAQLDGRAEVAVDEHRAQWEVDIHGQDVRFGSPDGVDDGPPAIGLLSQVTGQFDRALSQLHVDRLQVEVADRRHPLVTATLARPLILRLAADAAADRSAADAGDPIVLTLQVNRLGLGHVRPWMTVAGVQMPAEVRNGALDAELRLTFTGDQHVALAGRLDLEHLALERMAAPVTLSTTVAASVIDRSRLLVEGWDVRVSDDRRRLAELRLTGSARVSGAADVHLTVTADALVDLLARLGLVTKGRQKTISGGHLTGDLHVVTAGPSEPVAVTADLRTTNLLLRSGKSQPLTQTVSMGAELELNGARTVAEIRRLELVGESAGRTRGTWTATGRWPITPGPAGAMTVTIREWDSGPVLEFLGLLPGRVPGALPVNAEVTVSQQAGAATLALQGKESVGPLQVKVHGQPSEPATLHVQHDLVHSGEELRIAAVTLTVDRMSGPADRVSMQGRVRTGSRPRVELHGAVNALDADWYAALAAAPAGAPPAGPAQTTGVVGAPIPLDLDLAVTLGTVTYRGLSMGPGRLVATGDGRRLQATLESTGLAGGTVQGTATVAMLDSEAEFGWSVKGNDLDLGILTKVPTAGSEPRVTGKGTFTTTGNGRGPDAKAWQRTLSGSAVFDVADGQFIQWRVLDFLADQTRIEHFRGLGFRTLHGELALKDGWVSIDAVRAHGPLAGFEADGKFALDGRLDIRVAPKIGPTLASHVKIPCLDQVARTAEGFTVLPLAVTVKGTAEQPTYGVAATPGSMVERQAGALVGTIADLLTGCQGGDAAQRMTKDAVEAVKDTAKDLVNDLFGTKKKRQGARPAQ